MDIDYTIVLNNGWAGLWKSINTNDPNQIVMVEGVEAPTKKELDNYWALNKDKIIKNQKEREIIRLRREAYQNEADPLFFKWQRGEIEKKEYTDKVEEIRQRIPKPE